MAQLVLVHDEIGDSGDVADVKELRERALRDQRKQPRRGLHDKCRLDDCTDLLYMHIIICAYLGDETMPCESRERPHESAHSHLLLGVVP
jgi:hypothetical protein